MIQKIEVLAADVDMTLSAKSNPLPEIAIQALQELHNRGVKFDFIIGMNGGIIYDRSLNKSFTMDMLSIEEMKEILTFLMPIIEEKKFRLM